MPKSSRKTGKSGARNRNWSHDETLSLISIWGDRDHQQGYEGRSGLRGQVGAFYRDGFYPDRVRIGLFGSVKLTWSI